MEKLAFPADDRCRLAGAIRPDLREVAQAPGGLDEDMSARHD